MSWMLNSSNKPDAMLTLGCISLAVVLVKFFLSEMSFGSVVFGQIDGMTIASILTPTLGAYVARRYTDINANKRNDNDK